jgi:hypothetical protein
MVVGDVGLNSPVGTPPSGAHAPPVGVPPSAKVALFPLNPPVHEEGIGSMTGLWKQPGWS